MRAHWKVNWPGRKEPFFEIPDQLLLVSGALGATRVNARLDRQTGGGAEARDCRRV